MHKGTKLIFLAALSLCIALVSGSANRISGTSKGCPESYALKDSGELTHAAKEFYRNKKGCLYELTPYQTVEDTANPEGFIQYFNGNIPQYLDPYSFEGLENWYAKDKNFVYGYRPTSEGMNIYKIEGADPKTFEVILSNDGLFAKDKWHVYNDGEVIKGLDVRNLRIVMDKDSTIVEMISGKHTYKPGE